MKKVAFYKSIPLDDSISWHLLVGVDKSVAYAEMDQALESALISAITLLALSFVIFFVILTFCLSSYFWR
ncbi:hypothetical protein QW180_12450 [Vibrio sinaloensis]|nr:hypothetical protein [Vibrio sinaloensis]